MTSSKISKRSAFAFVLTTTCVAVASIAVGCSSSSPSVASSGSIYDSGIYILPDGAVVGADGAVVDRDGGTSKSDASTDSGNDSGAFTGPPPPASLCSASATFGTGTLLSISTSGDDILDSITPDELSIAWTQGSGSSAVVFYADRSSASSSFGTPKSFAAGQYTADRVALSPDGLRLIVVNANADLFGFSELTRAARGDAFGAPALGAYSNIDSDVPVGGTLGDPVIDSSDTAFYYSVYGVAGATKTIYRALRLLPTDPWDNGAAVNVAAAMQTSGSSRRRPTAISSDSQTIFFYDQVTSSERAGFINETTGEFDSFVDLGARLWAAPSANCGSLYYSAAGTSSVDLFVATH